MKPYSKELIEAFVNAYSRNVACASEEAVRAFMRDYNDDMGCEQLRDLHEYSSNIEDALCMFCAGMDFKHEQEEVVE